MRRLRYLKTNEKISDREKEDFIGDVKQVMQICYKAHQKAGVLFQGKLNTSSYNDNNFIITFNKDGNIIHEISYSDDKREIKIRNDKRQLIESIDENLKHPDWGSKTIYKHDKDDNHIETISYNHDGSVNYRTSKTYNKDGKSLEDISYNSDDTIKERHVYTYDKNGNYSSLIYYNGDESIKSSVDYKCDEHGNIIEQKSKNFEKGGEKYDSWHTNKYNKQGKCIEQVDFNMDGTEKKKSTYKYDSEGNFIRDKVFEKYDPFKKAAGETEETEFDKEGNWIKKTTFLNKIPTNIYIREVNYFKDKKQKEFIHPITLLKEEEIEDVDKYTRPDDFEDEEAKWLVEGNSPPESFPFLRYYILRFKEMPSKITYSGSSIEAIALLNILKKNMNAYEAHSYCTVWNGRERLVRYTLTFPGYNYILHALHIQQENADKYEVPEEVRDNVDSDRFNYNASTSNFELLRPSVMSGKRDEYFEEELQEFIEMCTLRKVPDKPTIQMIEVRGNSFDMVEHAVDDDFEIKDLNVNYGYGFEKFHKELMSRFNTDTKGLVLFHGQPGTGKTYYIRHLLRKMVSSNNKIVIYMPPNMVDHLVEPGFMTFLTDKIKRWSEDGFFSVLLIEDAEPLLAKRQEGVRIQGVTNLLNISDGILNDILNLQIICTFNVDLKKLDSALLRPGRLIARKEFKPLSELDANLLAQRLGIEYLFTKPVTIGEVYSKMKNKNTLIHDVDSEKGASTVGDDF